MSIFLRSTGRKEQDFGRHITLDLTLGYSVADLTTHFDYYIDIFKKEIGWPLEKLLNGIKQYYNGYSWDGVTFMRNPFSILNLFSKRQFGNFWFATGTPTFLLKELRHQQFTSYEIAPRKVSGLTLDSFDIEGIDPIAFLFQTGYLTIKKSILKLIHAHLMWLQTITSIFQTTR
jgi:hypothetical protein